jgi:FkbM family methyltransferase
MHIKYGILDNNIDVTDICLQKLNKNNIITIPSNDHSRASYFTDPLHGILKAIFVYYDDCKLLEFKDNYIVKIDLNEDKVFGIRDTSLNDEQVSIKLSSFHSTLHLNYGNFNEEYPEQKMATKFLSGNEKVLEIGGNIGRNSLIIASILESNKNFDYVVLESDNNIANQLIENRNINNLNFIVESSALSKRKLVQCGWDTIPSEILLDGYNWVNTITFEELKNKYKINFDTLIIDCEGAFFYIIMDMPEILNNISLIIMENDYHNINHKQYVDKKITESGFIRYYVEPGGWGPCFNNFFEVWKKI